MPWSPKIHDEIQDMFQQLVVFDWQPKDDMLSYELRLDNDLALQLKAAYATKGPRGHMARQAALAGVEKRRKDPKAMTAWKKKLSKSPGHRGDPGVDNIIALLLMKGMTPRYIEEKLGHRRSRVLRIAKERGISVPSKTTKEKNNV